MLSSTYQIIEEFPKLKPLIKAQEQQTLDGESLKNLNEIQLTFFRLACFFQDSEKFQFDLRDLYKYLNNDYLEWALELIATYFREDTFLIQHPKYSIIRDKDSLLNPTQLANYLTQQGLSYDRQKINLYYGRGKLFEPSLVIGGTKYWDTSNAQKFVRTEKIRLNILNPDFYNIEDNT